MRRGLWVGALLLATVAAWGWSERHQRDAGTVASATFEHDVRRPVREDGRPPRRATGARWPADLPPEAVATLARIETGGPFAYRQDGNVFENREQRLPRQPRGYYREYTVDTPGSPDRGARRIVAGGDPPVEFFYTSDHYRSFRRLEPDAAR